MKAKKIFIGAVATLGLTFGVVHKSEAKFLGVEWGNQFCDATTGTLHQIRRFYVLGIVTSETDVDTGAGCPTCGC